MWIGIGALLTLIPILIIGIIMLRMHRYDFGTICGVLCGIGGAAAHAVGWL